MSQDIADARTHGSWVRAFVFARHRARRPMRRRRGTPELHTDPDGLPRRRAATHRPGQDERMTNAPPGAEGTMQELPAEECYRLLATHELGRLGVNAEHYPLIIPVNYGLDGTTIVIRT